MIDKITPHEIISYVEHNGWINIQHNNEFLCFDDPSETVTITVPNGGKFMDYELSLLLCLHTISNVEKCSAFKIYANIKRRDGEVFGVREIEEILTYLGTTKILR